MCSSCKIAHCSCNPCDCDTMAKSCGKCGGHQCYYGPEVGIKEIKKDKMDMQNIQKKS